MNFAAGGRKRKTKKQRILFLWIAYDREGEYSNAGNDDERPDSEDAARSASTSIASTAGRTCPCAFLKRSSRSLPLYPLAIKSARIYIYYNRTNYELAYTVEYLEDKVIVVIMAGTRENFYDQLKQYMGKL